MVVKAVEEAREAVVETTVAQTTRAQMAVPGDAVVGPAVAVAMAVVERRPGQGRWW